jgi:hypothetical protein
LNSQLPYLSIYLSHSSVHKVTNVMNIRLKMNMWELVNCDCPWCHCSDLSHPRGILLVDQIKDKFSLAIKPFYFNPPSTWNFGNIIGLFIFDHLPSHNYNNLWTLIRDFHKIVDHINLQLRKLHLISCVHKTLLIFQVNRNSIWKTF